MIKTYHVKKGDEVKVISGDAKGKVGTIGAIIPKTDRVVVKFSEAIRAELKLGKRSVRKSNANPNGGYVDREYSTHVSNVQKVSETTK